MSLRQFEFYEFAGVLAPGTTVIVATAIIFPGQFSPILKTGLSLGDLGVVVIMAYVIGHLTQAIGNGIECLWWWAWRGWPSDWIGQGRVGLLNRKQLDALESCLEARLGLSGIKLSKDNTRAKWHPVTRQIHAAVGAAGAERLKRVETFNGNYGLFRGIASAMLITFVMTLVTAPKSGWSVKLMLLAAAGLALLRMHRFGKHYARELFVQFLSLPGGGKEP